jgi:hypothetical protein
VNNRYQRLLQEIEAGALDDNTPIGDLLRKVIALGGQAGSTAMRDWATRELRGFGRDDELPPYRRITAPLLIDWQNIRGWQRGEAISSWELPKSARGVIPDEIGLRSALSRSSSSSGGLNLASRSSWHRLALRS